MRIPKRHYNLQQQANLKKWFATRPEKTKKHAAIAWACEQDDAVERLMDCLNRTEQVGDCLIWTGAVVHHYSAVGITITDIRPSPSVHVAGHRLVFALTNGIEALPEGTRALKSDDLVIDHLCGNSKCVQPQHLRVITHSENTSLQGVERIAPPLSFGRVIAVSGEMVA